MTTLEIYLGSNSDQTKLLYAKLESYGPVGVVAMNLFRAQKCSERAKVYRGGSGGVRYRDMAYERKNWSIKCLCEVLEGHGNELGIEWGWKQDPEQEWFPWVLYVELPTGQVSFHSQNRGVGPDFDGEWDMRGGMCPWRIVKWVDSIIETHAGVESGKQVQNESR